MPLDTEEGLGRGYTVLDGTNPLSPKGHSPQFSAHFCCGQTAGLVEMPLGTEVGLGPGDIVLDGDPAPTNKGQYTPHFSAHVFCGQKAGCIKMPLGTEIDLGPGYIVLDGYSAPPHGKGHSSPPFFGPCFLWPKGRPSQALSSC